MRPPVNLASRPVRNDRLPASLFVLATAVLVAVSVQHALLARRLMPSRSAALEKEVAGLEQEMENLKNAVGRDRPVYSPVQKKEWALLKDLVDQRMFSWTELFSHLEEALPGDVRITVVGPRVKNGIYSVDLTARVPNMASGVSFVRVLEQRAEFDTVNLKDCSEGAGGFNCVYAIEHYVSQAPAADQSPPLGPVAALQAASAGRRSKKR